jgi:hypothetical protein
MTADALVCCAYPFGYGPVAKLMLIAQRAQSLGISTVFLGDGIAHELALRSSAFHDVIRAAPDHARAKSVIQASRGLLSMMDRDYAATALDLSIPVYAADSLAWMRDRVPNAFRAARRYWVQRFPGASRQIPQASANAVVVGPLVPAMTPPAVCSKTALVVNLGGCESPHGSMAADPAYADFVMRGLLDSGLTARFAGNAVLLSGNRCTQYLRERYADSGLDFDSRSHDDTLALLATARFALTSPGLTTSLECFQIGVPTFFLPPQNFSQWLILKHFRTHGLAPFAFHWQDLPSQHAAVLERLPGDERTPRILEIIRKESCDPAAGRLFREGLSASLSHDNDALAEAQRRFFASIGIDGVEQVANDLASLL